MKRFACMIGVLSMVIAAALVTGQAGAGDEAASIKDLMRKLHKDAKAPLKQLQGQLKGESAPDWAAIKSQAKEVDSLSAALDKFDPPRGDASAYKARSPRSTTIMPRRSTPPPRRKTWVPPRPPSRS